jgi:hypothetical protein
VRIHWVLFWTIQHFPFYYIRKKTKMWLSHSKQYLSDNCISKHHIDSINATQILRNSTKKIVGQTMLRNWIIILLFGTTVAGNLFILQGKLIIVCNFFTSFYMPFCIYKNLFFTLNSYNLCVTVGLPKVQFKLGRTWNQELM